MPEVGEAFQTAIDWLIAERQTHQASKWDYDEDDRRTREDHEEWVRRIDMYLDRARVLTLENPLGRQAIAKAAATAVGYLESVFRVLDEVPAPGSPSGEIKGTMKLRGGHSDSV